MCPIYGFPLDNLLPFWTLIILYSIISDECGFQLYGLAPGDEGLITTPNYPDGYPPSLRCIWWLKVSYHFEQNVNHHLVSDPTNSLIILTTILTI